MSDRLRKLSVLLLKRENVTLFIENGESTTSTDLLRIVSEHYNMTTEEYCDQMLLPTSWGGGPEIVSLSNPLAEARTRLRIGAHWSLRRERTLLCAAKMRANSLVSRYVVDLGLLNTTTRSPC